MQFAAHIGPRRMLLAMAAAALVEASPHDHFWGLCWTGAAPTTWACCSCGCAKSWRWLGPGRSAESLERLAAGTPPHSWG